MYAKTKTKKINVNVKNNEVLEVNINGIKLLISKSLMENRIWININPDKAEFEKIINVKSTIWIKKKEK